MTLSEPVTLDVKRVRSEFPLLAREIHPGVPLIYLDSAATSQKPSRVIEAMTAYYQQRNANIHRGIHRLASTNSSFSRSSNSEGATALMSAVSS